MDNSISKIKLVEEIIEKHMSLREPRNDYVDQYEFTICPGSFSPFIAPSGRINIEFSRRSIFANKRVLEIGCGIGVISCLIALNGASSVTGVDINALAIENAKHNAEKLGLSSKTEFKLGYLFNSLPNDHEFDIIYADLPFTHGYPSNVLEKAFYDPNLWSIRNLLWDFCRKRNFFKTTLYLCLSDFDSREIIALFSELGLCWKVYMNLELVGITLNIFELKWEEN
jgi:hypothetical protein